MTLRAATAPARYEVVGAVEVTSVEHLEDALRAFSERCREVGADHGQIDRMYTTFETRMVTSTQSYSCGTPSAPRTCTRQVTQRQLVILYHFVGRAMRTR